MSHFTIVREFERKAVTKLIEALLAAGYTDLNINHDGDDPDTEFKVVDTSDATHEELEACGTVYLYALPPGVEAKDGNYKFIYLVYGNGAYIISDYSSSLQPVIDGVEKWLDKYQD
jgi:hypothetical protein